MFVLENRNGPYTGDRGTVEHGVQWNFWNIFIEYAIGLVIFLYSDTLQC